MRTEFDSGTVGPFSDGRDNLLERPYRLLKFGEVEVDPAELVECVIEHRASLEVVDDLFIRVFG